MCPKSCIMGNKSCRMLLTSGAKRGILGAWSCIKRQKCREAIALSNNWEEIRGRRPAFDPVEAARPEFVCPACGAPVYQGERYFTDEGGRVVACEHCPSALA